MTKEQDKAIEIVNRIRIDFFDNKYESIHTKNELEEKYEALCEVLSSLKEKDAEIQQKNTELAEKNAEIEKKDKIIDLMARAIDNYDSQLVINTFKDKEHVKQYFERESKE